MSWWAGRESNPHSRRRLIYSQRSSPPAQPTHGDARASGRGPRGEEVPRSGSSVGADDGTRTRNRRFTKPLLYQLSYVGARRAIPQKDPAAPGNDTVRPRTVKRGRAGRRRRTPPGSRSSGARPLRLAATGSPASAVVAGFAGSPASASSRPSPWLAALALVVAAFGSVAGFGLAAVFVAGCDVRGLRAGFDFAVAPARGDAASATGGGRRRRRRLRAGFAGGLAGSAAAIAARARPPARPGVVRDSAIAGATGRRPRVGRGRWATRVRTAGSSRRPRR